MQKLYQERTVHTDFYRKEGTVLVATTWLHDYAHDIGTEVEMDMDKGVVTDAKFMFENYPAPKCILVLSETIDQANAILFLASDEARYITGQLLVVDRGMCL